MPRAPKKCGRDGCETRVVARKFCAAHTPTWQGSRHAGSTRQSRATRAAVLRRDPICRCAGCRACTTHGCTRPSTDDDHVHNIASGGNVNDISNRQGMCNPCHKVKTQREAVAGRNRRA